jgi:hypothetical protein
MIYDKNWKPFSNGRIRMMYEATSDDRFETRIGGIIADYNPPDGIREKRCCVAFGKELLRMRRGEDNNYTRQLIQYTMWNVQTLEYLFKGRKVQQKVETMLACEGLPDKGIIKRIAELEQKIGKGSSRQR